MEKIKPTYRYFYRGEKDAWRIREWEGKRTRWLIAADLSTENNVVTSISPP
jgi:hypothetical protein